MKRSDKHKTAGRKCSMESLEGRLVMAGVVTAWVDGSQKLHLEGDTQANCIRVFQDHGVYKVQQTDGSTLVEDKFTHKKTKEPLVLPAFTSIVADLGAGNDSIVVGTRGFSAAINKYTSISIDVGAGSDNEVFLGPEVRISGDLNIKGTGNGGSAVFTKGVAGGATKTVGGKTTIVLGAAVHSRISLMGEFGGVEIATMGGYTVELGGPSAHTDGPSLYSNFKARSLHLTAGGGDDTLQMFNGEITDSIFADLGGGKTDFMHVAYFSFPKPQQNKQTTKVHTSAVNATVKLEAGVLNTPGNNSFDGFRVRR